MRIGTHPDVVGLAREGLIRYFLQDNLPTAINYITGEIFDHKDDRSGQVDIIVQSQHSPRIRLFGDIEICFVDAMLAAIEVKSRLTTANWQHPSHLKAALDSFVKIKNLSRRYHISGAFVNSSGESRRVVLPNTPCMIFAYHGPERSALEERLHQYGQSFGLETNFYWPEVITVLDRGYYVVKNDGWSLHNVPDIFKCSGNERADACLFGMYQYLVKLIEAWIASPTRFMNFSEFVAETGSVQHEPSGPGGKP